MMNVTQTRPSRGDKSDRPTAEIARMFDVAGREDEAIRLLDGCMTRLHQAQLARSALKALTAFELRAALEFRRQLPRGEPA